PCALAAVLHPLEVTPELPLADAADDRLGELEEAARLALADEGQPRAAVSRLQHLTDRERDRPREDLQGEATIRLVLGHFELRVHPSAEELAHLLDARPARLLSLP